MDTFRVVLEGRCIDGFTSEAVEANLTRLMRVSAAVAGQLLQGQQTTVKQGVDRETGERYLTSLRSVGMACRLEPENLAFDVAESANPPHTEPDVVTERASATAPSPEALPNPAPSSTAVGAIRGGLVVFALVFGGISAWRYFEQSPAVGSLSTNALERALIVGKSTRADFAAFKDAGGLDNKEQHLWRGYRVNGVSTGYDDKDKLNFVNLFLRKDWPGAKLASNDNLRTSMQDECGSEWKRTSSEQIATVSFGKPRCRILAEGSKEIDVMLFAVQATASVTAPAAQTPASEPEAVAQQSTDQLPTASKAADEASERGNAQGGANAGQYAYEQQKVLLIGELISADGETPDGKAVKFPALKLAQPIVVQGNQDTPTEKGVILLHMALNQDTMQQFTALKGKSAVVEGTLYHSDNGNHHTNVLITPSSISLKK